MAKQHQSGRTVDVVEQLCTPLAERMGLYVWDVTFAREGADWILRVLLDGENGVDLDTAVEFSQQLDPLLDEADPIQQSYSLEVCSAGINRELTRDRHFEACIGMPVFARTIRPAEESGERDFSGELTAFDRETVTLENEGGPVVLRRDNLAYVKLDDLDEEEL